LTTFPRSSISARRSYTAEYSQSLYRTWDEYEITTLFNTYGEPFLVAEVGDHLLGFALGTSVKKHLSHWKHVYPVLLGVRRDIQQDGVGSKLFKEN